MLVGNNGDTGFDCPCGEWGCVHNTDMYDPHVHEYGKLPPTEELKMICSGCGATNLQVVMLCDQQMENEWCQKCFSGTPCGKGLHDESCPTRVFNG